MTFQLGALTEPHRRQVLPAEEVAIDATMRVAQRDRAGRVARELKKGRGAIGRYITLACLILATMAAAPTVGAQSNPMAIPDNLQVPDGNVLLFRTFATGTQIYVCSARADDADTFAWTFTAPEAELWNDAGEQVGTHYAGPSWEGNDGSPVIGEVMSRTDTPTAGAIPWLLLKAKANTGRGIFSTITYIQRLETVGGVAPMDGCDRSTAGVERGVPYTAIYAFYFGACCGASRSGE